MPDDLEDFEFAVSERFHKFFSRRRPAVLATPRELVDYVSVRSEPSTDQRSLKQHAFYFIRSLIAQELKRATREIEPGTRLADLMPVPELRREQWSPIRETVGVPHFPRLSRSSATQWTVTLIVAALSFAVFLIAAWRMEGSSVSLVIGLLSARLLCAVLLRLTEQFATEFLPPHLTVGDLASYATAYGSKNRLLAIKPSTRSQNLEIVRDLVHLEIGATKINEDATWEDLLASVRTAR